ncbi:MAG: AIR synthase family protein [Lachnospiraceae bacterium]|nr:AIR synthase family protein [Lachnospiraceae bacterium]MDD6191679.1 AIR synthase family protein [Lachnospiraceae bacterium]
MKVGKVPENVLKRSVIKQLHYRRDEVIVGPGIGEDCAALALEPDEMVVMSTDPITGTTKDIGKLAIQITANDLASAGAEPIGVLLTILLPDGTREIALKRIMEQMELACRDAKMQILGGHTEVTKVVNQPVVSVTGVAKAKKGQLVTTAGARPGMDIVVTKWIGLEGTTILSKEKEAELKEHFPEEFVDTAISFEQYLSVIPEAAVAVKSGVGAMHDVTEGGIFGALWEMAEASDVGLEIDLKKIPIRQETIEVCEYFDVNPYGLISSGSMLMAAEDGEKLVDRLARAGIPASVVGKAVAGNDRVILRDGERRFLEPPKTDELYKVL